MGVRSLSPQVFVFGKLWLLFPALAVFLCVAAGCADTKAPKAHAAASVLGEGIGPNNDPGTLALADYEVNDDHKPQRIRGGLLGISNHQTALASAETDSFSLSQYRIPAATVQFAKEWQVTLADVTANARFINLATGKPLAKGCYSTIFDNVTQVFVLDAEYPVEHFLLQLDQPMQVLFSGTVCLFDDGLLGSYDNNGPLAMAKAGLSNFVAVLLTSGVKLASQATATTTGAALTLAGSSRLKGVLGDVDVAPRPIDIQAPSVRQPDVDMGGEFRYSGDLPSMRDLEGEASIGRLSDGLPSAQHLGHDALIGVDGRIDYLGDAYQPRSSQILRSPSPVMEVSTPGALMQRGGLSPNRGLVEQTFLPQQAYQSGAWPGELAQAHHIYQGDVLEVPLRGISAMGVYAAEVAPVVQGLRAMSPADVQARHLLDFALLKGSRLDLAEGVPRGQKFTPHQLSTLSGGVLASGQQFELGPALGNGSFGIVRPMYVFDGVGSRVEATFAVKVLQPSAKVGTPEFDGTLLTAKQLGDHPSFLKTYGLVQDVNGRTAIVSELANQNVWDAFVSRRNTEGAPSFRQAAKDILDGMDHLHKNGKAHWDFKPGNLVVVKGAAPGNVSHVKIIDLDDVSQAPVGGPPPAKTYTSTYAAPERLRPRGGEVAWLKSDVYSVGVSLLEMKHGRSFQQIFKDVTGRELMAADGKHISADGAGLIDSGAFAESLKRDPRYFNPSDVGDVATIRALDPNPATRPSMEQFRQEFEPIFPH